MTQVFTVTETISQITRLTEIRLSAYIEAEAVTPAQSESGPLFDRADLARLDLLCELDDLYDLGPDGLAVLISVLDQLHSARADRKALLDAISAEPPEVRARIAAALIAKESEL
jgi:chaperone modulatory protein CbpM